MSDLPTESESPGLLLSDSSTLINFLRIGRRDLLTCLPYRLLVTDVVRGEIKERYQSSELEEALERGEFEEVVLEALPDLQAAAALVGCGLGDGEAFSIVAAHLRGAVLAIDDRKATKTAARIYPALHYLTTAEIIVLNIQAGVLTVEEADAIKDDWRLNHRFTLNLTSFAELVPATSPRTEPG